MREEPYKNEYRIDGRRGRRTSNILDEFRDFIEDRRGRQRYDVPFENRRRIGYDTYNHNDSYSKNRKSEESLLKMLVAGGYAEDGEHFNKREAENIVEEMYHVKDGKKFIGEKYDIHKAHEVCERYKEVIPDDVTVEDIYVAINAQYHDYCNLFDSWFGGNIDSKVFESAIIFWFKDSDFEGNKVFEYFNM